MSGPSKAEVIREELERIKTTLGRLTPEDVVERARPNSSPLHSYFTWNTKEAAEAHRLNEARALVRSVRVSFTVERGAGELEDIFVRRWVAPSRVGLEPADGYQAEDEVRENPVQRTVLLRTMEREISALHRRYRHLREYWEVLDDLAKRRGEGQAEAVNGP